MSAAVPAEPTADRSHLDNSRQIRWERRPATPAAQALVEELAAELEQAEARPRGRTGADRARLRVCLGAVLMDLLVAAEEAPGRWLAIPMGPTAYTGSNGRYLPDHASYRLVTAVVDFFREAGLVELRRGSYKRYPGFGPQAGQGFRTRVRPTGSLLARAAARGVSAADAALDPHVEVIRLKGLPETRNGPKPLLAYEDTTQTEAWRDNLAAWQEVVDRHDIRLDGDASPDPDRGRADEDDGCGEVADLRTAHLYRVFNEGRWDRGGRFYGGWWQALRKADRARITIDGEAVVELDFKAMHARMAYQLSGLDLPPEVDPYAVPGLPPGVTRDHVKRAFNQLIAVGPDQRIRQPDKVQLPRPGLWPKVLKAVATHHAAIARRWFRQARALDLQHLDSAVADSVMSYFSRAMQRPILPVHDSFIVAASDEAKLGETMMLAYRGVLNARLGREVWPVVDGWTEAGLEARIRSAVGADATGEDL